MRCSRESFVWNVSMHNQPRLFDCLYIQLKCCAFRCYRRVYSGIPPNPKKSFSLSFFLFFKIFSFAWCKMCTLWPASSAFPFRFKHPHQSQHISRDGRPHTEIRRERGKNRRAAALVASILFELEREETTSIRKHKRTRGTYIIRKKEKKKTRHNGLRHDGQGRAKEETTKRGKNYKELAAWAIDGRLLSSCPTAAVSQENERCCSCSMSTAKQQKKKYSI